MLPAVGQGTLFSKPCHGEWEMIYENPKSAARAWGGTQALTADATLARLVDTGHWTRKNDSSPDFRAAANCTPKISQSTYVLEPPEPLLHPPQSASRPSVALISPTSFATSLQLAPTRAKSVVYDDRRSVVASYKRPLFYVPSIHSTYVLCIIILLRRRPEWECRHATSPAAERGFWSSTIRPRDATEAA